MGGFLLGVNWCKYAIMATDTTQFITFLNVYLYTYKYF